jgi:3-methyladenine DNA glycosylase AlkC
MADLGRRRGARVPTLVPPDVLLRLEAGEESVNHMEQVALDMGNLLAASLPELAHRGAELRGKGLVARMRAGGRVVHEELGAAAVVVCGRSTSDTVRGWAAMAISHAPDLTLAARLRMIRQLADDSHFAVREWAWLAMRAHIARDVRQAVALLTPWTQEDSQRLRRFASEATRPRGVWSAHLPVLKANPQLGLDLLEPLRSDPARYVQDSVGNWLNDASKTRPEWVIGVCERWTSSSTSAATARICRRARRSLSDQLKTEPADL